mgnify:FL=1
MTDENKAFQNELFAKLAKAEIVFDKNDLLDDFHFYFKKVSIRYGVKITLLFEKFVKLQH